MKKKKRTKITQTNRAKKDPALPVLICQISLKSFAMAISSSRRVLLRMIKEILLKWKVNGSTESLTVSALLTVTWREVWSHLLNERCMVARSGQSSSQMGPGCLLNTAIMAKQVEFREHTRMTSHYQELMGSFSRLNHPDGSNTSSKHRSRRDSNQRK